jgi:hypothetical protein
MDNMHEGGCLCGSVRYRVQGEPAIGMVCHCRFCQRRLATAFAMVAYFAENQVEMLQGELSTYEHRSDETSRWLRLQFCPRCGTTICHTAEARPGFRGIAAGTFDDPDWFKIERHIWTRSARPWVAIPAGVQVFDQAFQPQQK